VFDIIHYYYYYTYYILYYTLLLYYYILYYTLLLPNHSSIIPKQYSPLPLLITPQPSIYSFYTCRYLHILIYIHLSSLQIFPPSPVSVGNTSSILLSFPNIPFLPSQPSHSSSSSQLIHSISRLKGIHIYL
jgi:hypothetical protein